ncbi:MAG: toxic anion resistance protein [Magnetospiraceae bacterium]
MNDAVDTKTQTPPMAAPPLVANLPAVITTEVKTSGDLIDTSGFTPEELARAQSIAAEVDFGDTNTIMTFGVGPQKQINSFLDTLLEEITVGDAGVAGKLTLELSEGYDMMRIDEIKKQLGGGEGGVWSSIGKALGFVKDLGDLIKNMRDQKSQLVGKFDKIEAMANDRKRQIMTYNVKLDKVRDQTDIYLEDMAVHIAAGEFALLRGVSEFDERKTALTQKPDDVEAAKLHDLARAIASFEQRLLRMKIAYTQSVAVTRPRIQAIRQAGDIEIQNIIESMLFDVPNLKSLVLQVAAMTNLKQAQEEDAKRRDVSQKIAGAATDMFHETYTTSIASQGRGLDDVRALAATADKLVSTLREGEKIEQENKKKRAEAASALADVKHKVTEALQEVRPDLVTPGT